jgi:GMP synthase-like glutamine amidotransferase
MARQVLFLYNDPTAPAALLGETFAESGFDVATFEVVPPNRADDPVFDVSFPDPLRYDVIVPLGARWAVYDERLTDRWVGGEIDMVRSALDAGVGVLGVCFGGQLLAAALGGTVARSPQPEVGWCDVDSSRPDLVPPGPWFQWHFDRLTAPPGAVEVARNAGATQAFIQGRAMGLQFHPEVDRALVERWIVEDTDGDMAGLGVDPDDLRARTAAEVDDAARRLRLLVRGFVGLLEHDGEHNADRIG